MLKNAHDVAQFTYFLTAELVLLSPNKLRIQTATIGPREGSMLRTAQPSPDSSRYLK